MLFITINYRHIWLKHSYRNRYWMFNVRNSTETDEYKAYRLRYSSFVFSVSLLAPDQIPCRSRSLRLHGAVVYILECQHSGSCMLLCIFRWQCCCLHVRSCSFQDASRRCRVVTERIRSLAVFFSTPAGGGVVIVVMFVAIVVGDCVYLSIVNTFAQ